MQPTDHTVKKKQLPPLIYVYTLSSTNLTTHAHWRSLFKTWSFFTIHMYVHCPKNNLLSIKTEPVPAGTDVTVYCMSVCPAVDFISLTQKPDKYRYICSKRDRIGFMQRFWLFSFSYIPPHAKLYPSAPPTNGLQLDKRSTAQFSQTPTLPLILKEM